MRELLTKGSIVVVFGPGGVGKTTVAAALALAAARNGLHTGLITVDPARRLRDALGIERLSPRPTPLDSRRLRAAGVQPSMRLAAMMLDVKGSWDSLVEDFIASPQARCRMLENPFYRSLTQRFAGAEAYAALAQLCALHEAREFDIEIVDTPPAAHAFEFFDAPRHLVKLLDSPAARWLLTPETALQRSAVTLASRAAHFVTTHLESFTGTQMLSALSEFLGLAARASGALGARFRKIETMLHSPSAEFLLVASSGEDRLEEALELVARTERQKLNLRGIVLNRMLDECTFDALLRSPRRIPGHLAEATRLRRDFGDEAATDLRFAALVGYLEDYAKNQQTEIEQAAHFAAKLHARVPVAILPAIEMGVGDLRSLAKLASLLD